MLPDPFDWATRSQLIIREFDQPITFSPPLNKGLAGERLAIEKKKTGRIPSDQEIEKIWENPCNTGVVGD